MGAPTSSVFSEMSLQHIANTAIYCILTKSYIVGYFGYVDDMARMGEERGVYRVLVGKPEGRRPLGRPRLRWVDNIRMDENEMGWICGAYE